MGWDGYLKNEIVRAIRKELERSDEMAENAMLVKPEQPENAALPMLVTELGRVMLVRPEQP